MTATFTPYEGWESDMTYLADKIAKAGSLTVRDEDRQLARRILAAFESPKCGKVLHPDSGPDHLWHMEFGRAVVIEVLCGLPAGHHRFVPRNASWPNNCLQCSKRVTDPIHSPGHVPDVPPEAWR